MVATITREDLSDEFRHFSTTVKHDMHKEFLKLNMRLESLELSFATPGSTPTTLSCQRLRSPAAPPCPPQVVTQPAGMAVQASQAWDDRISHEEEETAAMTAIRQDTKPKRTKTSCVKPVAAVENGQATEDITFRGFKVGQEGKPGHEVKFKEAEVLDYDQDVGPIKMPRESRTKMRLKKGASAADAHDWLSNHHFRSFKTGQEARFWGEVEPSQAAVSKSHTAKKISRSSVHPSRITALDSEHKQTAIAMGETIETADEKRNIQGYAKRLAANGYFGGTIAFFIFANALTIGLQADVMARNKLSETPFGFRFIELLFCAVFTIEIVIKLAAYRLYYFCMPGWAWNVFDFLLVAMQLTEEVMQAVVDGSFVNLSAMRVLRILRVVRIIRVIRLLRMISDLRAIIASVVGSLRALGWTVVLLVSFMYILSVYLTQLVVEERISRGSDEDIPDVVHLYGSLGESMLTLYQSIAGGIDWDDAVRPLMNNVAPVFGLLFSLYIAFTVLAIMNVVTGVFVESALHSAREDKDIYIVNHIRGLIDNMTTENNGVISWDKFQTQLDSEEMAEVFKTIDVDIKEAAGLFRLLDLNGNGEVDSEEFLDGCLRLRGPAKALDMALLMREIRRISSTQDEIVLDLIEIGEQGYGPQKPQILHPESPPSGGELQKPQESGLRHVSFQFEDGSTITEF